jgi:hypothetical protein
METPHMSYGFAIFPDGNQNPTAFFEDLEDATEWALDKYGSDRFSIRYYAYLPSDPAAAKQN